MTTSGARNGRLSTRNLDGESPPDCPLPSILHSAWPDPDHELDPESVEDNPRTIIRPTRISHVLPIQVRFLSSLSLEGHLRMRARSIANLSALLVSNGFYDMQKVVSILTPLCNGDNLYQSDDPEILEKSGVCGGGRYEVETPVCQPC